MELRGVSERKVVGGNNKVMLPVFDGRGLTACEVELKEYQVPIRVVGKVRYWLSIRMAKVDCNLRGQSFSTILYTEPQMGGNTWPASVRRRVSRVRPSTLWNRLVAEGLAVEGQNVIGLAPLQAHYFA